MPKSPLAIDEVGFEIVVRIGSFIARRSITDFEINDVLLRSVRQLMRVTRASFEASTHSWRQLRFPLVGYERRSSLQYENNFVL